MSTYPITERMNVTMVTPTEMAAIRLSALGTLEEYFRYERACQIPKRSSNGGKTRVMTLLGMNTILNAMMRKPKSNTGA